MIQRPSAPSATTCAPGGSAAASAATRPEKDERHAIENPSGTSAATKEGIPVPVVHHVSEILKHTHTTPLPTQSRGTKE